MGRQDLPATDPELWEKLAPRIRHLTLFQLPVVPSPSGIPALAPIPKLEAFLLATTSLVSLHLSGGPIPIVSILAIVPTRLTLLHTKLFAEFAGDGDPTALLGALDLPAMAAARRWRLIDQLDNRKTSRSGRWEEWAAACRARGIEPRGDERYYTGELPPSSSSSSGAGYFLSSQTEELPVRRIGEAAW